MKKLLYFHAPWCAPCRFFEREFIKPLADAVGAEKIQKINVQDEPFEADRYGVTKLPRAMILIDKKVVDSAVGLSDFERCKKILGGYYDKA